MSVIISESELPRELSAAQAVEAAYAAELAEIASKLQRNLPCLIECDKDLAPFLYVNVRSRLKANDLRCLYLDGRPRPDEERQGAAPMGLMGTMIAQLRDAVRGPVDKRVIVLPHLDLVTTSQGGLTSEAREVIPLLYENPEMVWLGFKDPSFPLPRVIQNLFTHHASILGVPRARLRHLVTQRESRKFGRDLNPWALYKHVSGVNAVRLRRLLETLEGEDYPANPKHAFQQLRQATLAGMLEVPNVELDKDIGGYAKVRKQLRAEILDVMARKDQMVDADEISRLEELIPKGMIFWGPPGTGKTLFAKGMAAALGAAITIVSGPELKSKWVGESEENLRLIFHKARQSAPSIIVFDELDSFASARGTYTGSGVEHSMVNQLLTEMDGFHKEELIFVIGTTNYPESLDTALLRPGRFEFLLHVPYPDNDDRREIIDIYDGKMRLQMTGVAIAEMLVRTDAERGYVTPRRTQYSGDDVHALCRAIARIRARDNRADATTPRDVDRALTEYHERTEYTDLDARVVAAHEAGHFVCAVVCNKNPDRVTIQSDMPWVPAFAHFEKDKTFTVGFTCKKLFDDLCVLFGGIEAERLLQGDVSSGAANGEDSDLAIATRIARAMIEMLGMGSSTRVYFDYQHNERQILSAAEAERVDREINLLLTKAQKRAATILAERREYLERVRDALMEKQTIIGVELCKWMDLCPRDKGGASDAMSNADQPGRAQRLPEAPE